MKRWNVKSSVHAHTRMAELRARKERLATSELARQYNLMVLGREAVRGDSDAIRQAMKRDGFQWGVWTEAQKQDWFRSKLRPHDWYIPAWDQDAYMKGGKMPCELPPCGPSGLSS